MNKDKRKRLKELIRDNLVDKDKTQLESFLRDKCKLSDEGTGALTVISEILRELYAEPVELLVRRDINWIDPSRTDIEGYTLLLKDHPKFKSKKGAETFRDVNRHMKDWSKFVDQFKIKTRTLHEQIKFILK